MKLNYGLPEVDGRVTPDPVPVKERRKTFTSTKEVDKGGLER